MVSAHSTSSRLHCLFSSSSLSAALMHLRSLLLLSSLFLLFIPFQQQKHVYAAAVAACMCVHVCVCARARLRAVSEEKVFTAVMAKHGSLPLSLWFWMYGNSTMTSTWCSLRVFMCSCTFEASADVNWGWSAVIQSRHWRALQSRSPYFGKALYFFGVQLQNSNPYLHVLDTVFVSLYCFALVSAYLAQGAWSVILWVYEF